MTFDLNNLALNQPYHNVDVVTIADGSTIPITHTSSTFFPTNTRDLQL